MISQFRQRWGRPAGTSSHEGRDSSTDPEVALEASDPKSPQPDRVARVTSIAGPNAQSFAAARDILFTENHYNQLSADTRRLERSHLADSTKYYAPAEGWQRARGLLLRDHVVILSGTTGIGKRTTAEWLLLQVADDDKLSEDELSGCFEIETRWGTPRISDLPTWPNCAFMLDLAGAEDEPPSANFGERLHRYSTVLRQHKSFLVICVTEKAWRLSEAKTTALTVPLGPPAIQEVVHRRLTDTTERLEWLHDRRFVAEMTGITKPADAVRLAESMLHAPGHGENAKTAALEEFHRWHDHLTRWLKGEGKDVVDRATLVAAAVAGQASAHTIVAAADQLLARLDESRPVLKPLTGLGASQRLARIEAGRVAGKYDITLDRPHYDEAVLDYVWDEWREMGGILGDWFTGLSRVSGQYSIPITRIAQVATGMAVRRGLPAFLPLIENLILSSRGRHELATELVEGTVLDPTLGTRVRGRLMRWTEHKDERIPAFVAGICGGRLGKEKTLVALKRLQKILARADAPAARRRAQLSIRELSEDRKLRKKILETIGGWIDNSELVVAGGRSFLCLIELGASSDANGVDGIGARPAIALLADIEQGDGRILELLASKWLRLFDIELFAEHAESALQSWIVGIDSGLLPSEPATHLVRAILARKLEQDLTFRILANLGDGRSSLGHESIRVTLYRELIGGRGHEDRFSLPGGVPESAEFGGLDAGSITTPVIRNPVNHD